MSLSVLERQNNFIYFDKDLGRAQVTPQSMELPEVKKLFRRDKSMGKKFFQKCVDFLYYSEHKDSPLSHKIEELKINDIKRIYESLRDFDESNTYYLDFKRAFIESHYSMKEIRYLKAMRDIEIVINMAIDIPIQVEKKVELKKEIVCFDESGNEVERTITFHDTIKIDNSTEKTKAISNIKALDSLSSMLEQQLKAEYRKEKTTIGRAIFDK